MEVGDGNFSVGGSNIHGEIWQLSAAFDDEHHRSRRPILTGKHFDIEAYASNYQGRTKILRLLSMAHYCGGDERRRTMQLEALRLAYGAAKEGKDVSLFTKIVRKINGRLGPNFAMDEDWCRSVNRTKQLMEQGLETWLQQCEKDFTKNILSTEGIRTAYNYAGDFYYAHGALLEAAKRYKRTRSFKGTDKSHIDLIFRVFIVLIETGRYPLFASPRNRQSYCDPIAAGKQRCAFGLVFLKTQRFRDAANKFLKISRELGSQFSVVMAPHDIAAYGGLCALATMERTELKTLVLDNDDFQSYLDSAVEVRELISDFYSGRFCSCFEHLDNLREWLPFDRFLNDQFETLCDQIKNKAMVLYVQPFVSVDLKIMANVFSITIEVLEKKLKAFISTNQIKAKIDSIDKVLHARNDQRNATFRRVLQNLQV